MGAGLWKEYFSQVRHTCYSILISSLAKYLACLLILPNDLTTLVSYTSGDFDKYNSVYLSVPASPALPSLWALQELF